MAERVHTVRSVTIPRQEDHLWMATLAIICVGILGIIGKPASR